MFARRTIFAVTLLTAAASPAQPANDLPGTASEIIGQYLKHDGFQWKCERTSHFQLCFNPSLESDPSFMEAKKSAEKGRSTILHLFHEPKYDSLIYVFFLRSRSQMKELIGYDGEGRSRPNQHAVFFVVTPIRPDLTHELTHEILTNLWGAGEHWIEEGLAVYSEEGYMAHIDCQALLATDRMIPLASLVNAEWNPASMDSTDIAYRELAGFTSYLIDSYGLKRLRQAWAGGSKSIPEVYGKSVDDLEHDWHARLKRK
jgi:hypothetical protein